VSHVIRTKCIGKLADTTAGLPVMAGSESLEVTCIDHSHVYCSRILSLAPLPRTRASGVMDYSNSILSVHVSPHLRPIDCTICMRASRCPHGVSRCPSWLRLFVCTRRLRVYVMCIPRVPVPVPVPVLRYILRGAKVKSSLLVALQPGMPACLCLGRARHIRTSPQRQFTQVESGVKKYNSHYC
jgi:hypothetical protein